jgi:hypothetical protein
MRAWPLPPLIVLAVTGCAIAVQPARYLWSEVVVVVLAVALWAADARSTTKQEGAQAS